MIYSQHGNELILQSPSDFDKTEEGFGFVLALRKQDQRLVEYKAFTLLADNGLSEIQKKAEALGYIF
jgi:hypothetical protein